MRDQETFKKEIGRKKWKRSIYSLTSDYKIKQNQIKQKVAACHAVLR
jgi:hypothetical protein